MTTPELTPSTEADEINWSLCRGFIFRVLRIEIDRITSAVGIDRRLTKGAPAPAAIPFPV